MLNWDQEVTPHSPTPSDREAFKAAPSELPTTGVSPAHPTLKSQPSVINAVPLSRRVKTTVKRVINGKADTNQRVRFKYLASCTKHGMPQDINLTRGVFGMNALMLKGCLRYVANRRASQIGLGKLFAGKDNPFPCMNRIIDLKKERNFFETRVIECQTVGALA